MERASELFVRKSYQISFVSWKSNTVVELVRRNNIGAEIIDIRALSLLKESAELFSKVDVGWDDNINVGKKYKICLAIFTRNVS